MGLANERIGGLENKKLFVDNLGNLLSQTRENIAYCKLSDADKNNVEVHYTNTDYVLNVNIGADSYVAIVYDVCRRILE